jgi:hypothetical protein
VNGLRFLFPKIRWQNVGFLIACGALGSVIAGAYGIFHDQFTYSLSKNYFTEFKFHQFATSDPRHLFPPGSAYADRIFVAVIGFLATWWVGLFSGWFLARASIHPDGGQPTIVQITRYFLVIIGTTLLFGVCGCFWGIWRPKISAEFSTDFMLVGTIHNCGYLGALVGLIAALILVRHNRRIALGNSKDTIANTG